MSQTGPLKSRTQMFSLVVLPTPRALPGFEQKLRIVSDKTSLAVYDLRQKLLGFAPTLIKRSADMCQLEATAESIRDAGFPAACVADEEVRRVGVPDRMRSLQLESDRVVLQMKDGRKVIARSGEPLFLVLGGLSLPGSHQLRIVRQAAARAEAPDRNALLSTMAQHSPVADIYFPEVGKAVRILGNAFNYAGLGEEKTGSSALNFARAISLLRRGSAGHVMELGFGLSTIPGCLPEPGSDARGDENNLRAFTRYSQLTYACFRAGLYAPVAPSQPGKTATEPTHAGSAHARAAEKAAPGLPPPPLGPYTVRRGAFRRLWPPSWERPYPNARTAAGALGPLWLGGPLLGLFGLASAVGLARQDTTWLSGAVWSLGLTIMVRGVELAARRRLIQNTPTSRIRSMAMGFVELVGKARQKYALKVPYLLLDCVHYDYRLLERKFAQGGARWFEVERGCSGPVPFFVEDDTGRVLVDPTGAMIGAVVREEISGSAAVKLGAVPMSPDQKVIVEYIPEGFTVYVYGTAQPAAPGPRTGKSAYLRRLRELKRSPHVLAAYDIDQDGRLSETEWASARRAVQRQADAERLFGEGGSESEAEADDGGETVVVDAGRRPGRFYVRGEPESDVLASLRVRMLVHMLAGAALFVGGFVYLMRALGAG